MVSGTSGDGGEGNGSLPFSAASVTGLDTGEKNDEIRVWWLMEKHGTGPKRSLETLTRKPGSQFKLPSPVCGIDPGQLGLEVIEHLPDPDCATPSKQLHVLWPILA